MTKWLLLISIFTGPTSSDKLIFEWHKSKQECEQSFQKRIDNSTWYGPSVGTHICIPFEN